MEVIEFVQNGVCSKKMIVEIENNIIKSYKSIGGCPGNSLGLEALLKDMDIDNAINRLEGIKCGFKSTSCPNELSKCLKEYKNKSNN